MAEDKMQKKILAIKREDLFKEGSFQGYVSNNIIDYYTRILNHGFPAIRGEIEKNPMIKHPIPYIVIINSKIKKIFSYQRSKEHHETRLGGKWSWGVGGHIDIEDIKQDSDPINIAMLRELNEEVKINGKISANLTGYINDDSNPVGSVHIGLLYFVETDANEITPLDSEIAQGSFKTIEELEKLNNNPEVEIETWSKIALMAIKELFKN